MSQKTKLKPKANGRPCHKPTTVTRRKVSAAAGGGMPRDEIAVALGISTPTLEKYYGRELNQLAFQKRLDVLDAHQRSAMKGNVSAQKSYLSRVPIHAVPHAPPAGAGKEFPLGKKDQANADAVGAERGTEWEDILPSTGTVQ